jgi:hypothetical protein
VGLVVVSDGLSPVSLGDAVSVWPRGEEDGVMLDLVLPLVAPGVDLGVAVVPGEAVLSAPAPGETVARGEAVPVGEDVAPGEVEAVGLAAPVAAPVAPVVVAAPVVAVPETPPLTPTPA